MKGEATALARTELMGAFQPSVNCDIIPCKAGDFVVQKRRFRLGEFILGRERVFMSEKHPECPLYNPLNCKEYYNPKLCAFVRKDKDCLKKKKPKTKAKAKSSA